MTLHITHIDTFILEIPTIREHVMSVTSVSRQSPVIVRLTLADGETGYGEANTISGLVYGEEGPESFCTNINAHLVSLLIGEHAGPGAAMRRINAAITGNRFAKAAVETALLDAWGKHVGLPVSELVGGRVRDRVPVLWVLASGDTGKDIEEAQDMLRRRRHCSFKLKIGKRALERDVAHVGAIIKALGDDADVRVDVNMAWDEATARRGVAMLSAVGCRLIEQPVHRSNPAVSARLCIGAHAAIMADEALNGPVDAFQLAHAGAADVFSVKIAQSGGLSAARSVAAIAEAAGIAVYGGTMLEGSIGAVASAHLASTWSALPYGTEYLGPLLLTEEILTEPLDFSEFSLAIPERPGLGICVDEDKLARLRRDAPTHVSLAGNRRANPHKVS